MLAALCFLMLCKVQSLYVCTCDYDEDDATATDDDYYIGNDEIIKVTNNDTQQPRRCTLLALGLCGQQFLHYFGFRRHHRLRTSIGFSLSESVIFMHPMNSEMFCL